VSQDRFKQKLARSLFDNDADRERFLSSLADAGRSAIIWIPPRTTPSPFLNLPAAPWQPDFVDLLAPGQEAGRSEWHERGDIYCLDLSSVFCAAVLSAINPAATPEFTVLDMCSAPGGKAIMASRMLTPQRLVCNETIRKRTAALISNLDRCSIKAAEVTSADSKILAETCPEAFSLVLVDAPCSGQSLEAKGSVVAGSFHPATINLNSNRQKRIIANSAKCVAAGGYLAYMTCTYSEQEDESVVRWLLKKFPRFIPQHVPALAEHQSHLADFAAYRLWPWQGFGAGGFCCLLKAQGDLGACTATVDVRSIWRVETPAFK
jgi:16S rRNA C967 or C1407 C5-methylase (RsmB/RsmF family)